MKSMRLADKLTDATLKENTSNFVEEKPEFPYGLRICLNEESLSMLGVKGIPQVGEKMKMLAVVDVCAAGFAKTSKGETRSVDLQITDMELAAKSKIEPDKIYDVAQPVK